MLNKVDYRDRQNTLDSTSQSQVAACVIFIVYSLSHKTLITILDYLYSLRGIIIDKWMKRSKKCITKHRKKSIVFYIWFANWFPIIFLFENRLGMWGDRWNLKRKTYIKHLHYQPVVQILIVSSSIDWRCLR